MTFIFQQLLFFVSIALVLFIPGYFLLLAIFGKRNGLDSLEKSVFSFGLSIITIDIALILLDKLGIKIDIASVLIFLAAFLSVCYSAYIFYRKKREVIKKNPYNYSRKQIITIMLIIFVSIFIRSVYLSKTIMPTGTDLGHHMFWTKKIINDGKIPEYQKTDIIKKGDVYAISEPVKIDDFIIGEHLIFATIGIISGSDVVSAFPSIVLFLINIMGLLVMFMLARTLFDSTSYGKNYSITVLYLLGFVFALSGSQANFISGGVIGNLLGNFFIPLIFYFIYRGLTEKSASFVSLGALSIFGLLYTHHLSTFIFIFALGFSLILYLIFCGKKIISEIKKISLMIFSPTVILVVILGTLFFFFVKTPSYIENKAVKTIIGEPSRTTKEGLNIGQLQSITGESRAILGFVGIVLLLIAAKKNKYQGAIIIGWFGAVFLMSWKPTLLHIDIPSTRIANYLSFPLILSGAFALNWFFLNYLSEKEKYRTYLNQRFYLAAFLMLFLYATINGLFDDAQAIQFKNPTARSIETFAVARYLADKTSKDDVILKDHNYISADSWMKVFLLGDYNSPLTRGFFFRYEGTKKREMCTLWMISSPKTSDAKKCFNETKTDFIVINPNYDGAQFNNQKQFWKIYASDIIESYYRPSI